MSNLANVIRAITPHVTKSETGATTKNTTLIKKEYRMDPATIATLITGIVTLIQQCRKERERTDDELVSMARGARGVMSIRKTLRAQGLRGRKFRLAQRQAVQELKEMSDEDLLEQVINAPEAEVDDEGNDGLDYDLF